MAPESSSVIQGMDFARVRRRPRLPEQEVQFGTADKVLPNRERLRVVIADNDEDTTDSLALLMMCWGYEGRVTHTGGEALALAFRYRPDVMLLDVSLPDLDGFCLARAIRFQPFLNGVLLVAVTGHADVAHRQMGIKAGFDHYLVKPVEPAVIQALVEGIRGTAPGVARAARGMA